MSDADQPALRTRDLEARYGQIRVLHGISIVLPKGGITAVLGVNGSGKSTLMSVIAGVHRQSAGSIECPAGIDISTRSAMSRVRQSGLVLVPGEGGIFHRMSVRENLEMGTRVGAVRRPGRSPAALLDEVVAFFPLLERHLDRLVGNLSGGERAMVRVGRALAAAPSVLMLDEPTNGLAPLAVAGMFERLRAYVGQNGISMLLVEQDAELALDLASYAYVMERGRIVAEGGSASLRASAALDASYLGIGRQAGTEQRGAS